MIKNLIKIAFRNLVKNRLFTMINIMGLAFGLASSLIISLWVWDELSYDQFHTNSENIYRLLGDVNNNGGSKVRKYIPSAIVEPMLSTFPEIDQITRVMESSAGFETEATKSTEYGIYADSSVLSIFSFPLKEGNLENILSGAQSVVISEQLAEKYFPGESALGKTISIVQKEKENYIVTGVLEKMPKQSTLVFDFILSYNQFETKHRPWWIGKSNEYAYTNYNVMGYVSIVEEADFSKLNDKLATFIKDFTGLETEDALFVFPFTDYYLHSDFSEGRIPTGKIQYVNLLSLIAFVVLLIACINFMNLSTARAGKRVKEVGLRKTVGATRLQLLTQFMVESILIAFISMIIAVTLLDILLPAFNLMTQKHIQIPFGAPLFILSLVSITVGTGLLAGCYPAFYLSAFSPIKTLQGSNSSKGALSGLRKGLVILQFTLSIIFIVFTTVVFEQVSFIQNKDLGIKKDNILSHPLNGITSNIEAYKNELLNLPGVQSVAFTEQPPLSIANGNQGVSWKGKPEEDMYFNVLQVGTGFIETFEIGLIDGADFPQTYNPDAEKYFIINEAAAVLIQEENPIGMDLQVWGHEGKVVGLARDFHHRSFEYAIEPVVMLYNPEQVYMAYIGIDTNNVQPLIAEISSIYQKHEVDKTFDYYFVEDQYNESYGEVSTIGKLANIFSAAAIFISCLGLFGLSAFITEQRTKETGVRKVLGASEWSLMHLFSIGFIKLVLVAFVIATPVAWLFANYWLADYAYKIELGISPFIIAGVLSILIALLTVSYNTLKAALLNPIDSLKHE